MNDKLRKDVLASIPQAQNYQIAPAISVQAEITPVATKNLDPDTFPKRGAGFDEIIKLAYSFDGYAHYGMEACAELANKALSTYYHSEVLPEDVTELRACLFFEGRRWTLYQTMPDTKANLYIFALIDELKKHLKALKDAALK